MAVNVPQFAGRSHEDMLAEARAASLEYVCDDSPGITRIARGRGFEYRDPDGKRIADEAERERIKALAIPPAWDEVWICPSPRGHILATGRDEAGRKQYIYHERWEEQRTKSRCEAIIVFGHVLPAFREQIDADLRQHSPSRSRSAALACAILDETYIRVGRDEYARDNETYGLTTLQKHHVVSSGPVRVVFEFVGKGDIARRIEISDRRIASHIERLLDLPGDRLFQWVAPDGKVCPLTADDVNRYIQEHTGPGFSAKDFRTWGGCITCADALLNGDLPDGEKACQKRVVEAVKCTAEVLGNTPAVARGHYIHIGLLRLADDFDAWKVVRKVRRARERQRSGRATSEQVLLQLLAKLGW